jgi:hypothetical protein
MALEPVNPINSPLNLKVSLSDHILQHHHQSTLILALELLLGMLLFPRKHVLQKAIMAVLAGSQVSLGVDEQVVGTEVDQVVLADLKQVRYSQYIHGRGLTSLSWKWDRWLRRLNRGWFRSLPISSFRSSLKWSILINN